MVAGMAYRSGRGEEPRVIELAIALVAFCDRIEPRLRRTKFAINAQLQDAASSALANAGEAWDEVNPAEKRRFFIYSLRSAGECQRELKGAAAAGAISPEELEEGLGLILALKLDLRRLIAWCERRMDP